MDEEERLIRASRLKTLKAMEKARGILLKRMAESGFACVAREGYSAFLTEAAERLRLEIEATKAELDPDTNA